jgi:hypothetical protein
MERYAIFKQDQLTTNSTKNSKKASLKNLAQEKGKSMHEQAGLGHNANNNGCTYAINHVYRRNVCQGGA